MGPRVLRALVAVAALVAAALLPATIAAPVASAAPASSCSTTKGVLVVVDLRHFGGSLTRGCDPSPSTGYAALHNAGYTTAGTQHDGTGFVCRIDGYPTKKQEACVLTPPASAYWSYWHADAGRTSWTYSSLGAQSYHPKQGSIDAWVFGSTNIAGTTGGPSFTPAQVRPQRASGGSASGGSNNSGSGSGGSNSGGSGSGGSNGRGSGSGGSGAGSARTGSPTPATSHGAGGRATGPARRTASRAPASAPSSATSTGGSSTAGSPVPSSSGVGAAPSVVDASDVAQHNPSSGGSPWPVILGVALVLLLGAGGGWGVLRRRRADAADH